MDTQIIEINDCKHYALNQHGTPDVYFIHSNFLVEEDYSLYHPLGRVYKPKGCIDTLIRFVRQPNNSTLMFKANEWNKPTNLFYIDNIKYRFIHFFGLFYSRESYLY